jgi:AraC-like DNA-binding protein
MVEIRRALPHSALRGIVRSFEERRLNLGTGSLFWPVAPRPDQIIDIYLQDPFRVRLDGGAFKATPEIVVVGPQTYRRAELCLSGEIHVFNILFQPAGFHRLTGIDMTSLVNQDPSAADILGKRSHVLNDTVRAAKDFSSRVAAAERWVDWLLEGRGPAGSIDHASCLMMDAGGRVRIDALVKRSDLGPRQFQRRFTAQVGLTPKLYARTIRFDHALRAHRGDPSRPWTDIVQEAGYFDQAHFIRECRALVGLPPSRFTDDWRNIFFPARD